MDRPSLGGGDFDPDPLFFCNDSLFFALPGDLDRSLRGDLDLCLRGGLRDLRLRGGEREPLRLLRGGDLRWSLRDRDLDLLRLRSRRSW